MQANSFVCFFALSKCHHFKSVHCFEVFMSIFPYAQIKKPKFFLTFISFITRYYYCLVQNYVQSLLH